MMVIQSTAHIGHPGKVLYADDFSCHGDDAWDQGPGRGQECRCQSEGKIWTKVKLNGK